MGYDFASNIWIVSLKRGVHRINILPCTADERIVGNLVRVPLEVKIWYEQRCRYYAQIAHFAAYLIHLIARKSGSIRNYVVEARTNKNNVVCVCMPTPRACRAPPNSRPIPGFPSSCESLWCLCVTEANNCCSVSPFLLSFYSPSIDTLLSGIVSIQKFI